MFYCWFTENVYPFKGWSVSDDSAAAAGTFHDARQSSSDRGTKIRKVTVHYTTR